MSIKANGNETLLKLVKNPVTEHFPVGVRAIGTSVNAPLVNPNDWVATLPKDQSFVIVIGAIAVGKIDVPYVEEEIAISSYPLSAAGVCVKMCSAFEQHWGIL
jgi:rRNA small subunit pseudouridine methyltransferase Nep1